MRSLNRCLLCLGFLVAACSSSSNGGDSAGGAGGDAAGGDGGGAAGSGGKSATGGSSSGGSSQGGRAGGDAGGAAGASVGGKGGNAGGSAGGAGGTAMGGMAGGMAGAGGVAPVAGVSGTGVFVAVGEAAVVLRSVDLGLTWQAAPNIPESRTLDNLSFGNGKFFGGTHQDANNPAVIFSSADGMTWKKNSASLGQWVGGVAFGNNVYVAVGGYGEAWYSSDAVTWTKASGRECSAARSVAFGAGTFTLRSDTSASLCSPTSLPDSNQWWTTTDGKVWKTSSGENGHTADVAYCGDVFKDRKNCTLPAGKGTSSAQGGSVWVAVVNGMIQRSGDNGTTWQLIAGTNKSLKAVAFGPKP